MSYYFWTEKIRIKSPSTFSRFFWEFFSSLSNKKFKVGMKKFSKVLIDLKELHNWSTTKFWLKKFIKIGPLFQQHFDDFLKFLKFFVLVWRSFVIWTKKFQKLELLSGYWKWIIYSTIWIKVNFSRLLLPQHQSTYTTHPRDPESASIEIPSKFT